MAASAFDLGKSASSNSNSLHALTAAYSDEIYIAPSGVQKERMEPEDMFVMTPDGGQPATPRSAFASQARSCPSLPRRRSSLPANAHLSSSMPTPCATLVRSTCRRVRLTDAFLSRRLHSHPLAERGARHAAIRKRVPHHSPGAVHCRRSSANARFKRSCRK